ncbi:DUF1090 domain-containing protein [Serratia ureilytica]|uniref:DUF1090 domain-containing protein n=1 Tax=Serratia ureilytica TaxID=300181 RepID=UPI00214E198E|nr:DUF1090 domain-containing protein [Serratia ureilytica]UUW17344.1 DUF1090 domain-containing protein [Serratia ureilytica]
MKPNTILALGTIMLATLSTQALAAVTGCEAKKTEIRTQIDYAKSQGNSHQVAGLEKALNEVDTHCTDASLQQDRQLRVAEKAHKVAERQREFDQAKLSGQRDKIDKKLKKLKEAEEELAEARAQLSK